MPKGPLAQSGPQFCACQLTCGSRQPPPPPPPAVSRVICDTYALRQEWLDLGDLLLEEVVRHRHVTDLRDQCFRVLQVEVHETQHIRLVLEEAFGRVGE